MHLTSRFLIAAGFVLMPMSARAEPFKIARPQSHQVVQRIGLAQGAGFADVRVVGVLPNAPPREAHDATWEYRAVVLAGGARGDSDWAKFAPTRVDEKVEGSVRVAAGGWYRLEIRCRTGKNIVAAGAVEPIGVGELFVVAGQSYATNCNDERLTVADAQHRVVAFDPAKNAWAVAHDPQPVFDGSDGGSIWPPLGDALANELQVPIGFANAAVGGSSSAQWLPEGIMFRRLVAAGASLGTFRAVLWQQGESDVISKNTSEGYVQNLTTIRGAAAKTWGVDPPWLLAKSTHHPTVYNDPEGEGRIRSAVDELVTQHGFRAGPDTDTLKGEHRGDINSRRHFSAIGQRRAAELWLASIRRELFTAKDARELRVGVAEADITPPTGFPMAGYYHERLAEGTIDPLKAKAIVFRDGETAAALVVCDLIGIATDLSREVRKRASSATGIPVSNIVIAATHSHTAPDYMKELYLYLGDEEQQRPRAKYIEKLIGGPVEAITRAHARALPSSLAAGAATQTTPVAFNRRFVMRDGSVRTWQRLSNPDVVRAAGPIDPAIGLLAIRNPEDGTTRGILSNFALHLDTVGGMRWSADYPFFIERTLRKVFGKDVISIFGTGCCGDINHADPSKTDRNKADFIGGSIGDSITMQIATLTPVENPRLTVKSQVVQLPLEEATLEEVQRAVQIIDLAKRGEKVDFFDHVTSYKKLILDQLLHREPYVKTADHITWGLSRSLAGIGATLPVDVTVMTIGDDVAIVCLPGEVFVELGLAIKKGSPFDTTILVELSNAVETIYVPHREAYVGGSYEVTNSALQPGGGEILVQTALGLLREAAATTSPSR